MCDGEPQRLPCAIVLETDPHPRLSFKITGSSPWMGWGSQDRFSIHIIHADVTCEALLTSANNGTIVLSPTMEPVVAGRSEDLKEVQFDLINFPGFSAITSTRLPHDHLDIAAEGWHVEIRPPRNSPDFEAFRSTLYSVTHSCTMRKSDNATFSSTEAQNSLNVLHHAMSFAAGRWVAPVFVRGFGSNQEIAWKEWATRPLHPSLGKVETWFDTRHANKTVTAASDCGMRRVAPLPRIMVYLTLAVAPAGQALRFAQRGRRRTQLTLRLTARDGRGLSSRHLRTEPQDHARCPGSTQGEQVFLLLADASHRSPMSEAAELPALEDRNR
jgi:hypothetical protein